MYRWHCGSVGHPICMLSCWSHAITELNITTNMAARCLEQTFRTDCSWCRLPMPRVWVCSVLPVVSRRSTMSRQRLNHLMSLHVDKGAPTASINPVYRCYPFANYTSENNLPTFRLNAPVVIREKVKEVRTNITIMAYGSTPYVGRGSLSSPNSMWWHHNL